LENAAKPGPPTRLAAFMRRAAVLDRLACLIRFDNAPDPKRIPEACATIRETRREMVT
jgi:hypothetical protein